MEVKKERYTLILLFLALTFSVAPQNHKLQMKLLFIQNGVVKKKL
jgi:hypothetical protein